MKIRGKMKDIMNNLYDKALKLKIVGVICPKNGNNSMVIK